MIFTRRTPTPVIVETGFFYGWVVVLISFFVSALGYGTQYTTGLFISHFRETFGISLSSALLATAGISAVGVGIAAPLVGLLLKRISARPLIATGLALTGAGFGLLAYSDALWQVQFAYGLLFSVGMATSIVAGSEIVSNWFVAKRALAMGLAASGTFAAGIILPPVVTYGIAHFGFREACLALAVVVTALTIPIYIFVVDRPECLGLNPYGWSDANSKLDGHLPSKPGTWTLYRLSRTPDFWVIAVMAALFAAIDGTVGTTFMQIATNAGTSEHSTSFILTSYSITALIATAGFGLFFDRLSERGMLLLTIGLMGLACLLLTNSPGVTALVVAQVSMGGGLAASTIAARVLVAAHFGREGFGMAFGSLMLITVATYVGVLWLFGSSFDLYSSYNVGLYGLVAILGVMSLVAFGYFSADVPKMPLERHALSSGYEEAESISSLGSTDT